MSSLGLRNSEGPDCNLRCVKRQRCVVGIRKSRISLVLPLLIWVTLDKSTFLSFIFFLCITGFKTAVLCTDEMSGSSVLQVGYTLKADYCHYYDEKLENWHRNRREKYQGGGTQGA